MPDHAASIRRSAAAARQRGYDAAVDRAIANARHDHMVECEICGHQASAPVDAHCDPRWSFPCPGGPGDFGPRR